MWVLGVNGVEIIKKYNMGILNFISTLFKKEADSPYKICVKTIKKMGYKRDHEGSFYKESSYGRTTIWITDAGIKIKVYANDYAESDFLRAPYPDADTLRNFIRNNQL